MEKTIQSKQAVNETNYLNSIPGMTDSIIKGIAESLDDCIPEEDIQVIAKLTMFACNLESKYKRNCAQHDFNDEKWITFYFRRT